MKFERLLSHSSIGFWNQPIYRKKHHNFSLIKKYGISAYTLRPYRNPLVLLQSETMNLANLSCLSINRKKYHNFSLVLTRFFPNRLCRFFDYLRLVPTLLLFFLLFLDLLSFCTFVATIINQYTLS